MDCSGLASLSEALTHLKENMNTRRKIKPVLAAARRKRASKESRKEGVDKKPKRGVVAVAPERAVPRCTGGQLRVTATRAGVGS